jgi:hypothetical protein
MVSWTDLWAGLALPAAMAAAVLLAGWRFARRRTSARDSRSWAGPAALAAGFVAGYLALLGRPGFPPLDATDWLFYLAPAVALLGLADSCLRLRLPARIVLIVVALPASFGLLGWPLFNVEGSDASMRIAVAAALAVASIVALDVWSARVAAVRSSAVLLAIAAPAAGVLMLSGSQRLGQIGGLLAASAAGMLAANLILGAAAVGRGTVLVLGTLLAGLFLCGNLYAELTTPDALLLAAAPNMAWLAQLVPKRAGRVVTTLSELILVLSVAGIAVARAWLRFVEEAGWA